MKPGTPAWTVCLAAFAWLGLPCALGASFENDRPGARAAGLGGAFCSVADDTEALDYNAAGLALVPGNFFSADFASLLSGLDDGSLHEGRVAYAQPIGSSAGLGVSWRNRDLAGLYQENTVSLGYGMALDAGDSYFLGGVLKLLQVDYLDHSVIDQDAYFSEGSARLNLGLDVGALAFLTDDWACGVSVANLNQPDLSLRGHGAVVPLQVRAGTSYAWKTILASADYLYYGGRNRFSAGSEQWWFNRVLGTREGLGLGDLGLAEITTGLSFRLQQGTWNLQLDYAFLVPLGEFSGAGATHLVNFSLLLGTLDPATAEGLRLSAAGDLAVKEGRFEEALDDWEQAADLLPGDDALRRKLDTLRKQLRLRSEVRLYMEQGEDFLAHRNYHNAAKAFRHVLTLDPETPRVRERLATAENALRQMTEQQQAEQQAGEKRAAARAQAASLQEAQQAIRQAERAWERAQRKEGAGTAELKRLQEQIQSAQEALRKGDGQRARVLAQMANESLQKLGRRPKPAAPAAETRRVKRAGSRPAGAAPAGEKAVATPAAGAVAPAQAAAKPTPTRTAREAVEWRKARGAYGRVVKLMLDIDRLGGSRYFPQEYAGLQHEVGRVKTLLNREDFPAVIREAEALFPRLERLQQQSLEKKKAREVMPTRW